MNVDPTWAPIDALLFLLELNGLGSRYDAFDIAVNARLVGGAVSALNTALLLEGGLFSSPILEVFFSPPLIRTGGIGHLAGLIF